MLEACIELESDPALVGVAPLRRSDGLGVGTRPHPRRRSPHRTELASNAVLHARTQFRLTLRSNGFDFLRIEVRDESTRMPSPAGTPPEATSGRGLAVVSAIAASWGTQRDGDGKVVWAEIGRTRPPISSSAAASAISPSSSRWRRMPTRRSHPRAKRLPCSRAWQSGRIRPCDRAERHLSCSPVGEVCARATTLVAGTAPILG